MDNLTKSGRSSLMSKIRGKNTKPELAIRHLIYRMGFRYRLHQKKLPGCPDIVFSSRNKVIFINGCFWHGHHCPRGKLPTTRIGFWQEKIEKNKKRDRMNLRKLRKMGWECLVLWECQIKKKNIENRLVKFLRK